MAVARPTRRGSMPRPPVKRIREREVVEERGEERKRSQRELNALRVGRSDGKPWLGRQV